MNGKRELCGVFLLLGFFSAASAERPDYRPAPRPPFAVATPTPTPSPSPTPIECLPVTIQGDYDRDCDVDGNDYMIYQRQFTRTVPAFCGADGNGDGVVDAADYVIWRDRFGTNQPGCHVTPTPTPAPAPVSPADAKNYIHPARGELYNLVLNLSGPRHVQVDVYTALGKKVKPLLDANLPAGSHTVSWDGKNDVGAVVASDLYIILIYEDGRLSQRKKVVIQR